MPQPLNLATREVSRIALLGDDYRNVSFELLLGEGDSVAAGAAVMRDARRPAIRFCAARGGRIVKIERGARRRLVSVQIEVDDDAGVLALKPPQTPERASLREFLLSSGCWASLRTRPFGNLPHPDADPAAIFVNALDTEPGAPEADPILDACADEFDRALQALAQISDAPVYVCHAPGRQFAAAPAPQIRYVAFDGGVTAGLAGVHINRLCPIGFGGGEVWQLGYQDAIAIGHALLHGNIWPHRVVALGGDAIKQPATLLVPPGASIDELLRDQVAEAPLRLLAGSELFGRPVARTSFLAAGQRQLSVLEDRSGDSGTDQREAGVIIPGDRLEALAPPGIYPVPLMRALQLGDAERARQLGALELLEEDLAPLSRACLSGNDYSALLRGVLDQLEGGA